MGDADAFDEITAAIDYPMYVVTTTSPAGRSGCLVGFATQASIEPRRFLIGLSKTNHTHDVAAGADQLAVHLIPREHFELAQLFGGETGTTVDKFAHCEWTEGPGGLPVLTGADMWFAGRVLTRMDLGDHTGYLLEPFDGEVRRDSDHSNWVHFADATDITPGNSA